MECSSSEKVWSGHLQNQGTVLPIPFHNLAATEAI